jgi:hypothetical protein
MQLTKKKAVLATLVLVAYTVHAGKTGEGG